MFLSHQRYCQFVTAQKNISEELLDEVAKVVYNIRERVRFYVPFNMLEMASYSEDPSLQFFLVMALTHVAKQPLMKRKTKRNKKK